MKRLTCRVVTGVLVAGVVLSPVLGAPSAFAAPGVPSAAAAPQDQAALSADQRMMLAMARQLAADLRQLHGPAFEKTFLAATISHDASAVTMAQLAAARAVHPALRAAAQGIEADRTGAVTTMTAWLRDWYGSTPGQARDAAPPGVRSLMSTMDEQMAAMVDQLAAQPAGPDFDKAFLTCMLMHDEMAVIEAGPALAGAVHPALRSAARGIVAAQSREAQRLRLWLFQWFGVTDGSVPGMA